jgi:transglutaminase-like putative cysteine protease
VCQDFVQLAIALLRTMGIPARYRSDTMDITDVEVPHDHVVRLRFADGIEKTVDLGPVPPRARVRCYTRGLGRVRGGEGRSGRGHDRVVQRR